MFFVLFRLLAKAASLDRGSHLAFISKWWCGVQWWHFFPESSRFFYSFRAFAVERYIPSPARILSWNNAIGRLLYPSWWCLVPLVRNDRFFCDVSFARGPSVYLAKGQCIALFFSFTILVFTTSLPRMTPHPFVFFYIINIFLEMLNQHLYLSFSFRHFFYTFFEWNRVCVTSQWIVILVKSLSKLYLQVDQICQNRHLVNGQLSIGPGFDSRSCQH